jgi:hypothetical protein
LLAGSLTTGERHLLISSKREQCLLIGTGIRRSPQFLFLPPYELKQLGLPRLPPNLVGNLFTTLLGLRLSLDKQPDKNMGQRHLLILALSTLGDGPANESRNQDSTGPNDRDEILQKRSQEAPFLIPPLLS